MKSIINYDISILECTYQYKMIQNLLKKIIKKKY